MHNRARYFGRSLAFLLGGLLPIPVRPPGRHRSRRPDEPVVMSAGPNRDLPLTTRDGPLVPTTMNRGATRDPGTGRGVRQVASTRCRARRMGRRDAGLEAPGPVSRERWEPQRGGLCPEPRRERSGGSVFETTPVGKEVDRQRGGGRRGQTASPAPSPRAGQFRSRDAGADVASPSRSPPELPHHNLRF